MNQVKFTTLFALSVLTFGCTGTIHQRPLSPGEFNADVQGIVYYPPALFIQTTKTTTVNTKDKDGKPIGKVSKCESVISRQIITRPDYGHPRIVHYEHGFLESYNLTVGLAADGSLQSVGTVSNPDRGQTLLNLTNAALNGAKMVGEKIQNTNPDGTIIPDCTDDPVVVMYEYYVIGNEVTKQ